MREARNDGAPSYYASKMHSESPRLPPPTHDSLLSPHKAVGLSAISASHTYHLRGSISSAALREKSNVSLSAIVKKKSKIFPLHSPDVSCYKFR